ncbi:MAG: TetR/AcrR family transcriptional repressor of nem operon [Pseudoalteromonas tetraodonis]|jgi:TetR/AcrR family transcriptional repressor of nem operon
MLERSFHSVGLNQILAAVKVPKGSFYHYFESKEQFGVEMLRHYANNATAWKRQMLLETDTQSDPLQRLVTFFNYVIGKVQENGGKCPCLIQKLAAEVADFSEPMRAELAKSLNDSIAVIQELLDEAVSANKLPQDLDTASEAAVIWDIWSGAQQRSSILRSIEPLRQAVDLMGQRLKISA